MKTDDDLTRDLVRAFPVDPGTEPGCTPRC